MVYSVALMLITANTPLGTSATPMPLLGAPDIGGPFWTIRSVVSSWLAIARLPNGVRKLSVYWPLASKTTRPQESTSLTIPERSRASSRVVCALESRISSISSASRAASIVFSSRWLTLPATRSGACALMSRSCLGCDAAQLRGPVAGAAELRLEGLVGAEADQAQPQAHEQDLGADRVPDAGHDRLAGALEPGGDLGGDLLLGGAGDQPADVAGDVLGRADDPLTTPTGGDGPVGRIDPVARVHRPGPLGVVGGQRGGLLGVGLPQRIGHLGDRGLVGPEHRPGGQHWVLGLLRREPGAGERPTDVHLIPAKRGAAVADHVGVPGGLHVGAHQHGQPGPLVADDGVDRVNDGAGHLPPPVAPRDRRDRRDGWGCCAPIAWHRRGRRRGAVGGLARWGGRRGRGRFGSWLWPAGPPRPCLGGHVRRRRPAGQAVAEGLLGRAVRRQLFLYGVGGHRSSPGDLEREPAGQGGVAFQRRVGGHQAAQLRLHTVGGAGVGREPPRDVTQVVGAAQGADAVQRVARGGGGGRRDRLLGGGQRRAAIQRGDLPLQVLQLGLEVVVGVDRAGVPDRADDRLTGVNNRPTGLLALEVHVQAQAGAGRAEGPDLLVLG